LTVADLVLGVHLVLAFQTVLDTGFRKAMVNVSKWMDKIIAIPEVVKRLGHVKFCAKAIPP